MLPGSLADRLRRQRGTQRRGHRRNRGQALAFGGLHRAAPRVMGYRGGAERSPSASATSNQRSRAKAAAPFHAAGHGGGSRIPNGRRAAPLPLIAVVSAGVHEPPAQDENPGCLVGERRTFASPG